ncbi:hypothetical protein PMI09_02191 [Rhizobium sp. CF122]|nr:hypothetical protein PMI09_02191 [Rhizobium sp. CF122]
MADAGPGYLGRPVCRIYESADIGGVCPIASDHTDELFDVVSPYPEGRGTIAPELGSAVWVPLLPGMIELA